MVMTRLVDDFATRTAKPKPERGSARRQREEDRAKAHAFELQQKAKAKKRDNHTCRWPHRCAKGEPLESAHIVDKSRGGSNDTHNLITLCQKIHRGAVSIHSKDLRIDPLTSRGADGLVAFYQLDRETGYWEHVATEKAIGITEARR